MSRFDLVIYNGLVVDGSGNSPQFADVGIIGDRIAKVGYIQSETRRAIDAAGRVVSPGFVDIHGHSDYSLLLDPNARTKIFQGVTTEVGGNCGYAAAPISGQMLSDRRSEYQFYGLDANWSSISEFRQRVQSTGIAINYGHQVGYNTLRGSIAGNGSAALSDAERDLAIRLTAESLREGCLGLSYGLAYAPACFSRVEELLDVARVAAEFERVITFHLRNEDNTLIESLEEALHIGQASGAATHIGHFKTFKRPNWGKIDEGVARIEKAREQGLSVTVDRYPYLAMNTQLKFVLPTWVLDGGVSEMRTRLRDVTMRQRIVQELNAAHHLDTRGVLISLVVLSENKAFEGRFIDEIAPGNPWELVCDLIATEGDSAFATFFGMSAENLDRILALDYALVASDASVQAIERQRGGGLPHPRCFNTFPYFIGEWVFAKKRVSLESAIRKITALPARHFGIADRGTAYEGSFADLVVFDPKAFDTLMSYETPMRYPPGIDYVVVNGELVIDGGFHREIRPGRYLTRGP